MRNIALALGAALLLAGPAWATSPVSNDADRALCEERGGKVTGAGASAVCATPAQDAACAEENGEKSAFDYQSGGCAEVSSEAGSTSGGWTDVK